jgi:hypothetical protein
MAVGWGEGGGGGSGGSRGSAYDVKGRLRGWESVVWSRLVGGSWPMDAGGGRGSAFPPRGS